MSGFSVLAFDYGWCQMGVAVGNKETKTASPLCLLKAKHGKPEEHKLQSLLFQWKPCTLVVGLPFLMDGTEDRLTKQARAFGVWLKGKSKSLELECELVFEDERLSSQVAKRLLSEQDTKSKKNEKRDDLAALIVLQGYLDNL